MKKVLLITGVLILFITNSLFANDADLFEYDESKINTELNELNELENYVNNNQGITLSEMLNNKNSLVTNMALDMSFCLSDDTPMGIPSFCWGCFFGPVGVLMVWAFTDRSKKQTTDAFWGCAISTPIYVVLGIGGQFLWNWY